MYMNKVRVGVSPNWFQPSAVYVRSSLSEDLRAKCPTEVGFGTPRTSHTTLGGPA